MSSLAERIQRGVGSGSGSAIDGRTTRHPGYEESQLRRHLIEQGFGWDKTVGLLRKLRHRGRERVEWVFTFTVTADSTGALPPEADAELTLSNYQIAISGELTAGTRTVAVHVEENPAGFMLHDVNLFRLEGGAKLQEIVEWMDWMDLEGFRAPAPGYSLGGVEHMGAGRTGYMTVELQPGNYAWVSEGYGVRGMVKVFTVE